MKNQYDERDVLVDLANAQTSKALVAFCSTWPEFAEDAESVVSPELLEDDIGDVDVDQELRPSYFLAQLLRRLWIGDEEAVTKLEAILLPEDPGSPIYQIVSPASIFSMDWRRGSFSYQPQSDIQRVFYYLLQHSDLAKRCGNTNCVRPYFLGTHGNDRYCSNECFVIARKESKRAWWEEHGEDWRRDRGKVKKKRTTKKPRGV